LPSIGEAVHCHRPLNYASPVHRTRLSLYYLVSYLLGAGAALLAAPHFTLKLLLSSKEYGTVMPRVVGLLLLSLGIVMFQIVRHRVEVMYPTTIAVRVIIVLVLVALYAYSRDPLFLVLIGVVGLGLILTGTSYLRDHKVATEPSTSGVDQRPPPGQPARGSLP